MCYRKQRKGRGEGGEEARGGGVKGEEGEGEGEEARERWGQEGNLGKGQWVKRDIYR